MGVGMDVEAVRTTVVDAPLPRYAVSTLSRLSRKKGLDLLIAAAERLAEDGVFVPIAIAGDGEDRDALLAMPKQADIHFPGFVSGAGKVDFFNESRFLAFPSVASGSDVEGLPVALLEALCCGKIVIAAPDTNIRMLDEWERITGDVVLVEDPRDIQKLAAAIKELLTLDPATQASRSTHLRGVMARYRWERLIEEYLEVIEALTGAIKNRML
jgi:glycosyltransferase involved in cell wall biosynthesis